MQLIQLSNEFNLEMFIFDIFTTKMTITTSVNKEIKFISNRKQTKTHKKLASWKIKKGYL